MRDPKSCDLGLLDNFVKEDAIGENSPLSRAHEQYRAALDTDKGLDPIEMYLLPFVYILINCLIDIRSPLI